MVRTALDADVADLLAESVAALRAAGCRFAYLHGSRAGEPARSADPSAVRAGGDIDLAGWFASTSVDPWQIALPDGVDLLILDRAPLELAGRVATAGRLLFCDDPPARVRWEATTRKRYLDEKPRIEQSREDFVRARRGRR